MSNTSSEEHTVKAAQRILIENKCGEKLIGILHEFDTKELVILCHGFQSSKEGKPMSKLSEDLSAKRISNFRFDFSGNGESEGSFQFGNYLKEVDDLRAVILYFLALNYHITAIVGHSKGGNVVLLYGSKYNDVPKIVNVSGRFDLKCGLELYFGKDYLQRLKADGFIDVMERNGRPGYRVTEESLVERLSISMRDAALSISEKCRVLTVHGSEDEAIPVGDASEFAKLIKNHTLRTVNGSDHCYTQHQEELDPIVIEFLRD